jgi:hypothetical protein
VPTIANPTPNIMRSGSSANRLTHCHPQKLRLEHFR